MNSILELRKKKMFDILKVNALYQDFSETLIFFK